MKPSDVLRAYFATEEDRELDRTVAWYAVDAVFETPEWIYRGRSEIRQFYADAATQFPGLSVSIGRCLDEGTAAAVEWRAVLTSTDGTPTRMRGVNLADVQDNLIVSARVYYAQEQ
jgi:ketosteroid isomerase-like protein